MRPDKIFGDTFNRTAQRTFTAKMERGRVSHVLFCVLGSGWRQKDRISLKLRYAGGTIMVIDRISAADLLFISDLKYGIPAVGTPYIHDTSNNGENPIENESNGQFITYAKNAILLPVGNIYLGMADAELEFTVETSAGGANVNNANTLVMYSIDYSNGPGHVLQWDKSSDLESYQRLTRELYLASNTAATLFPSLESVVGSKNYTNFYKPLDIDVQYEVDGSTYNFDLLGAGAITSLIGELQSPANNVVRIFEDNDNVPSNVWLKVSGDDKGKVYIIALRELVLPQLTINAQHEVVETTQRKMEKLERENADAARAYVQAGLAVPSATLQTVKDSLPTA